MDTLAYLKRHLTNQGTQREHVNLMFMKIYALMGHTIFKMEVVPNHSPALWWSSACDTNPRTNSQMCRAIMRAMLCSSIDLKYMYTHINRIYFFPLRGEDNNR